MPIPRIAHLLLAGALVPSAAAAQWAPAPPQNPHVSALAPTQHGDTAASDTSALRGPGLRPISAVPVPLIGVCPSVLIGDDNMPVVVCTELLDRTPAAFLLEPTTGLPLASLAFEKDGLFDAVYPYMDALGRVVLIDGGLTLSWVAHRKDVHGSWTLVVERALDLSEIIAAGCSDAHCDSVVGLAPDYAGKVWFVTALGLVGVVDAETEAVYTVRLPEGERVANSLATSPDGTAIVSDHALYMLTLDAGGVPRVRYRAPYDRGSARKPGKLSQGSGSTPTFFGPDTGTEYVAITDNAAPLEHLLVYASQGAGDPVCNLTLPSPTGLGSEVSPVGIGRSVFVSSTYGYPYPDVPEGAGESVPPSAPVSGGMSRVDLRADGGGCSVVWTNRVRSAAVPKLSTADGLLYTTERVPLLPGGLTTPLDVFNYAVIDPRTGQVRLRLPLGAATDTLQIAGSFAKNRVLWQGFVGGVYRIAPLF